MRKWKKEERLNQEPKKMEQLNPEENGAKESSDKGLKFRLMMCLVYVAVISTATYAWFAINNTPRAYNMKIMAGTVGDLQIADAEAGPYSDKLDLQTATNEIPMDEVMLNPITTQDSENFYKPVYTGKSVMSAEAVTDKTTLNKEYVYEKVYWLKAGSSSQQLPNSENHKYDIMLLGANNLSGDPTAGTDEVQGCIVKTGEQGVLEGSINMTGSADASNAIRISFQVENERIVVYEPNADIHNTGDKAENALSGYGEYETIRQNSNGAFENGEGGNSPRLFTITEGVPVKVTMRVWLEGTDDDCTNPCALDEILAQIQFVSAEAEISGR